MPGEPPKYWTRWRETSTKTPRNQCWLHCLLKRRWMDLLHYRHTRWITFSQCRWRWADRRQHSEPGLNNRFKQLFGDWYFSFYHVTSIRFIVIMRAWVSSSALSVQVHSDPSGRWLSNSLKKGEIRVIGPEMLTSPSQENRSFKARKKV